MAQTIEQAASRRSTGLDIVGPGGVNNALPEMRVGFCDPAVVDTGEFAVEGKGLGWLDAGRIGLRNGRIEGPADGWRLQFLALGGRGSARFGWEEEEDVAVCVCAVEDYFAAGELVAACCVAVERYTP